MYAARQWVDTDSCSIWRNLCVPKPLQEASIAQLRPGVADTVLVGFVLVAFLVLVQTRT